MAPLEQYDVTRVVSRLPGFVRQFMESTGKQIMAAGGFLRSTVSGLPPNDLDLFVSSAGDAELFLAKLTEGKPCKVHRTENAITVHFPDIELPIQIIHRWTFTDPQQMLESFDFTIAQSAIWFDGEWQSLRADTFYSDLAAKRLVYTAPIRDEAPGGSLLRVLKFNQQGFHIPLASLGATIARMAVGSDLHIVEQEARERGQTVERVMSDRFTYSLTAAYR